MKIVLGFIPWIAYFALIGIADIQTAIIVALGTGCVLGFRELRKGFVLPWGTVIFFLLLLGIRIFNPTNWLLIHADLPANSALAVIALASLAINKPFTLQYAREQVDKGLWDVPGFLHSNQILTAVWSLGFCICTMGSILHIYGMIGDGMYQILSYAPFVFIIWFTLRFPDWYRQRIFNRQIQRSQKTIASNPFLKGSFAPVLKEIDEPHLPIVGELPKDLVGIYMRNGPNPAFIPFSYTFPYDGDGMLHAIYIRNGKASYKNRFIVTDQLKVERRLGKAVYGGIDCPFIKDQKLLLPGEPSFPVKMGRFINVIRHANKYVAFHEANPAYEVDAQLATLGEWTPTHSKHPISVNPHPRLDPETGELYLVSYHTDRPIITYHVIDKTGALINSGVINIPFCCMVHDFVLTKNYFVLFICPVVIDKYGMAKGKHFYNWQPELNTQICIVSRAHPSAPATWIESELFFNFHFANAYENGHNIIIDYVRHPKFTMNTAEMGGSLTRATIDLHQKRCAHQQLDDRAVELPRFNDSKNGSLYRYTYTPCHLTPEKNNEVFNAIIKYDLKTNSTAVHDFGLQYEIGEAVFVPRSNSHEEDDGYLMLFATHRSDLQTDFFLLNAKDLSEKPIARVRLPQRIPHGLHGSWMAGPW